MKKKSEITTFTNFLQKFDTNIDLVYLALLGLNDKKKQQFVVKELRGVPCAYQPEECHS